MATKARQQYFADEVSLSKEKREFSIADDIQQKIDSVETGAQVNKIETIKVNGTALIPDAYKAVDIDVPEVIDNLYTVDSDNALSAKQGKLLYDYIQNIASRGRFLSNWNSATGLPMTNPSESPYPYKSGDYFVVSNVAGLGGTNYRPDGSSYTIGQASTVVETEDVSVSDFYFYDGTNWLLLSNSGRQIAIDTSLSTTSTNPVENRVITNALNGKQDVLTAGNHINITSNVISATGFQEELTAGENITIGEVQSYAAMQGPCTSGFHIPMKSEREGVQTILNGLSITSGQLLSEKLHMPRAGRRINYNGSVTEQSSYGHYWSSTADSGSNQNAYRLYNTGSSITIAPLERAYGLSIRPFKDSFVVPTASWTIIDGTLGGAGIFWDTTDGLISVTSDGSTGYTLSDKNLGATVVWSSGDTLSESNCGYYYQWGNNYGFSYTGSITTSTTLVDATNYGPGNYYSSSTFITRTNAWDTSNNNNLWGGATGIVNMNIISATDTTYAAGTGINIDSNNVISTTVTPGQTYTAGNGINIDQNNEISNTLPGPTIAAAAPTGTEGALWYDTTNDVLKAYNGTSWAEVGNESADINTKTFHITSTGGDPQTIAEAEEIYNWYLAGKNPIVRYSNITFVLHSDDANATIFHPIIEFGTSNSVTTMEDYELVFVKDNGSILVVVCDIASKSYLDTYVDYQTPYTPQYAGSPATKKYVDDHDTIVSATAPSNPTEGMVWYDSTNDVLKTYDGTNWSEAGTKMVVLEYGVSTWQDFLDAYNKNALVYCKVSSGSSGYRMAFMAYTAGTTTPTEVEFQYYRSRSSHSTAANQLDEVYVYKLTNAGVWTTTQRDTAAKAIAGTGIGLTFNSSGMTISADTTVLATQTDLNSKQDTLVSGTNIKTVNSNSLVGSGDITLNDVKVSAATPSSPTEGMVWYDTTNDQLKVYDGTNWNVTGKEYDAGPGIAIGTEHSDMQGPAPDGFHVPLNTEWQAVYNIWTALGGGSHDGTNFGIALKLPFAGYRNRSTSNVSNQGVSGFYWSSSRFNDNSAYYLSLKSSDVLPQDNYRCADGYSVRCFKNSPTVPTSSWTKLYGTSIESGGIFWSSADGLISLSSDGQTWITIQDKNLGATTAWNSGDTLSEANCGKYYQRGNNYGFAWTGSVTTGSTQVDASAYGPGNYYSSSTFITYNGAWDTTNNGNLWGGVSKGTWVGGDGNTIVNTGVLSVNGQTGNVTIPVGILVDSASPIQLTKIWAGTQAQYEALGSYDSTTVYLTI